MEFSMLEARERERDKVGFLLLPRSWKIGFNTFPIVRLIYINIQSREWRIYQASIERSEKLRVIRNSISMSHELYTYFVASLCVFSTAGTVVAIGFPHRSSASIVEITTSPQIHAYRVVLAVVTLLFRRYISKKVTRSSIEVSAT